MLAVDFFQELRNQTLRILERWHLDRAVIKQKETSIIAVLAKRARSERPY